MNSKKDHWQTIYKNRDYRQVGWYQESPDISLTLLTAIQASPSQSIIDVGCGTSVLVDNLIARGYQKITLLDFSREALALIRARLREHADIPEYLCEDIIKVSFNRLFDIWHDRAVFHFLTDGQERKHYMATLQKSLSKTGRAIIGTFSVEGPDSCSGLDVVQYNDAKMKTELPQNMELVSSRSSVHVMPGGSQQQYIYFIIRHKTE